MGMTTIRYTKIKLTDKGTKVHLAWEEGDTTPRDERTLTSADDPRPELRERLADLVPGVLEICELPEDYRRGMSVSGVSLSYSDDGVMGATIIASKSLETARAPLNLVTPHLPVAPYSESDIEAPVLPPHVVDALAALEDEANLYRDGDRAQARLPLDAAFVNSLANLAPGPDSGFASISISSPGHGEVTLTAEDGERLRKKARSLRKRPTEVSP
jgi:hypothetical protein